MNKCRVLCTIRMLATFVEDDEYRIISVEGQNAKISCALNGCLDSHKHPALHHVLERRQVVPFIAYTGSRTSAGR